MSRGNEILGSYGGTNVSSLRSCFVALLEVLSEGHPGKVISSPMMIPRISNVS